VTEPPVPAGDIYRSLCGLEHSRRGRLSVPAKEPPVDIFLTGRSTGRETVDSLRRQNYTSWRAWRINAASGAAAGTADGGDAPPGPPEDGAAGGRIRDAGEVAAGPPGARRLCWEKLRGEYCLFLPEGVFPRPDFLSRAVACLEAEPELAGVTCYAALSGAPGNRKYMIPCDLNRYLIFAADDTCALPALWRREAVTGSDLERFTDRAARWSFYCTLAARGEQVAVLPLVLLDKRCADGENAVALPLTGHAAYLRESAVEIASLLRAALTESERQNKDCLCRYAELKRQNEALQAEVQRLCAGWEKQKDYIKVKEAECAEFWNEMTGARLAAEEYKTRLNAVLTYLEKNKALHWLETAGIVDLKQFRRV
ncbi:glycosyltransferase family A protein, partial [Desulfotomaculum copahuensis]|uniref:glycosyltransferase family A protein n=1 Tax=Desulfotomaculum copahuensis TaxID=1838280 RepID=UPI000AABBD8A